MKENSTQPLAERSFHKGLGGVASRCILMAEDMEIREYRVYYTADQTVRFRHEGGRKIEVILFFQPLSVTGTVQQRKFIYLENRLYVYYQAMDSDVELHFKKDVTYQYIRILLDKDTINHVPPSAAIATGFVDAIHGGYSAMLAEQGIELAPAMKEVIQYIQGFSAISISAYFYIKSQVYLLMGLIFENVAARKHEETAADYTLKTGDLQKLHSVKAFITANAERFYTIEQLAKEFSMNASKLKKGFKRLFGMGVFEYTARVRMNTALELIQNTGLSFKEIAFQVGYSAPSSFTVAFKRQFGKAPRYFRPTS